MYSTAGHRQKRRTKNNPQQAPKNPPTEAQNRDRERERNLITKLGNPQSEKINSIWTSVTVPNDGWTGWRI